MVSWCISKGTTTRLITIKLMAATIILTFVFITLSIRASCRGVSSSKSDKDGVSIEKRSIDSLSIDSESFRDSAGSVNNSPVSAGSGRMPRTSAGGQHNRTPSVTFSSESDRDSSGSGVIAKLSLTPVRALRYSPPSPPPSSYGAPLPGDVFDRLLPHTCILISCSGVAGPLSVDCILNLL